MHGMLKEVCETLQVLKHSLKDLDHLLERFKLKNFLRELL